MPPTAQLQSTDRVVATLDALCDFLAEPSCRQCEVLAICLNHLEEDASQHSSAPSDILRALRRVGAFSYVRRRFGCRRCVPAEILAAYLTPGEEVPQFGDTHLPTLSWVEGEQDIHW
jgi:hypothetical protein